MESRRRAGPCFVWWLAWVLWCVPAGALAGAGLIELNWGGPPYDGGFLGDLVLFGGFLSLGQAPFVSVFVSALVGRSRAGYVAAVLSAVSWPLMGFVGWAFGSYFEVGSQTPLYSDTHIFVGVLPWLVVGALDGVVMVAALASVGGLRAAGISGVAWVVASATGGLFYEYWYSLDIAAEQNKIKDAIGTYVEGFGFAENVAFEVVPVALFLPLLYGIPTGLALAGIHRLVQRGSSTPTNTRYS